MAINPSLAGKFRGRIEDFSTYVFSIGKWNFLPPTFLADDAADSIDVIESSVSGLSVQVDEGMSRGLQQFSILLGSKTFILLFIRTLEREKEFNVRDKVSVASLLSAALQNRMDYHTEYVLYMYTCTAHCSLTTALHCMSLLVSMLCSSSLPVLVHSIDCEFDFLGVFFNIINSRIFTNFYA